MADAIREALERLLAVIKPKYTDPDEIVAVVRAMAAARTALAAEPPAPDPCEALAARPLLEAVARLGDCIGQHTVAEITTISDRAAAWLRENPPGQPVAIEPRGCPTPGACSCVEPTAPAPVADHIPDARNMALATDYAARLRQLPPEGLEAIRYCVEEDGAVIQRTSRAPESWAIRAGSSCMSTTGEWDIEPMPSDRTDEWLASHRWPSAAAAWEALQQARRQEVGDA